MTHTPRTRKMVSDSLHRQLNMYALAAGAAGVATLAMTAPAEGKIVYTRANIKINPGEIVNLDVNHDGMRDVIFSNYEISGSCCFLDELAVKVPNKVNKAVAVHNNTKILAAALGKGFEIGPKLRRGFFQGGSLVMAEFFSNHGTHSSKTSFGLWRNVTNKYLGLKFLIKGKIHYGWARLSVSGTGQFFATLTGYAYETIPGKAIIAGATEGSGEAQPASISTSTREPATLSMLALGTPGLSTWRREESVFATPRDSES